MKVVTIVFAGLIGLAGFGIGSWQLVLASYATDANEVLREKLNSVEEKIDAIRN